MTSKERKFRLSAEGRSEWEFTGRPPGQRERMCIDYIQSSQADRRGLPGVRPSGESVSSAEWVYLGYLFHG